MYKLIAFDIDGTTLPYGQKMFSKTTINMFKQLKAKGIITILITGRELITMTNLYNTPYIDYFAGGNGSIALDFKSKEIIWSKPFREKDVMKMFDRFYPNSDLLFIDSKNPYFSKAPQVDWFWKEHQTLWKELNIKTIKDEVETKNIHVIIFKGNDQKRILKIEKVKAFILDHNLEMEIGAIWAKGFFIQKKGINKGYAIKRFAKMLKIDNKETMAFGDGENDVELLRDAGYGIRVKTGATEVLKDVADDVCESPENNGVLKKLKELKIL